MSDIITLLNSMKCTVYVSIMYYKFMTHGCAAKSCNEALKKNIWKICINQATLL